MVSFWSRATQNDAPPPNKDARKEKERAWYSSISKKTVYPSTNSPSISSTSLPSNNNNTGNHDNKSAKQQSSFRRLLKNRASKDKLATARAVSATVPDKRNIVAHPSSSLYGQASVSSNHRTLDLAQRLQELASANKDGLLDDEEYRLLRAEAFQSQSASAGSGDVLQDAGSISSPSNDTQLNSHSHHQLSNSNSFSTLRPAPSLLSAESTRSDHSSFVSSVVTSFFRRGTKSIKSTSNFNNNNNQHGTGSDSSSKKNLSPGSFDRNLHRVTLSPASNSQANPIEISETLSVDSFRTGGGRGTLSLLGSIKSSPDLSRKTSFFRTKSSQSSNANNGVSSKKSISTNNEAERANATVHNRLSSSISLHSFSPRSLASKKYSHSSTNTSSGSNNIEAWTPRRIHAKSYNTCSTSPSLSSLSAFSSSSSRINNSNSSSAQDPWADASSEAIRREIVLIKEEHQRLVSSFDELSRRAQRKLDDDYLYSYDSQSQSHQESFSHTTSSSTSINNVNSKKPRPKSSITTTLLSTPLTLSSSPSSSLSTKKLSLMGLSNNTNNIRNNDTHHNSSLPEAKDVNNNESNSNTFVPPIVQIRPPSRVLFNDERSSAGNTNQSNVLEEIESINARKNAVNERYNNRLEYLAARLNSALIRERLPR